MKTVYVISLPTHSGNNQPIRLYRNKKEDWGDLDQAKTYSTVKSAEEDIKGLGEGVYGVEKLYKVIKSEAKAEDETEEMDV